PSRRHSARRTSYAWLRARSPRTAFGDGYPMVRSSASVSWQALDLRAKRAALPERADAADKTGIVELKHVNAVERHRAVIGHALYGPHHRCLTLDHEDLTRDDLDRLVPGHLAIPELADLAVPSAYRNADRILLRSVG